MTQISRVIAPKSTAGVAVLFFLAILCARSAAGAVALASSGTNIVPADPIVVTVAVLPNDYVVGAFVTDTSSLATMTYDAPMVEDYSGTSSNDGQAFYAASGKSTSTYATRSATNGQAPIGLIASFSGVDTGTPKDVTPVSSSSNAPVTDTANMALTTVTAGAMMVLVLGRDASTDNPSITVNDHGAGLTWSYITCYQVAGYRKQVLAYAINPSPGLITISANFGGGSAGYNALLYALRPASGASSVPVILHQILCSKKGC